MTIPKYHLVKENLKSQILSGKLAVNDKLISIRELIETYQISRATAWRVYNELNNEGFVDIRKGTGTFVRDYKSAVTPVEKIILLATLGPDRILQANTSLEILKGVQTEFSKQGYQIIYEWIETDLNNSNKRLEAFKSKLLGLKKNNKISGLILSGLINKQTALSIKETGMPFVIAGDMSEPVACEGFDVIGMDSFSFGYKLTKHLLELNHSRIGCIIEKGTYVWTLERLRGYKTAMKDAGCKVDDNLIVQATDTGPENGCLCMSNLLKLKSPPTAIVAFTDDMIIGTMNALAKHGLRIPRDISIVGTSSWKTCEYFYPFLTLNRSLPFNVGKAAVKALLDKITNGSKHKEQRVMVEGQFVKGKSCKILTP